MEHSDVAGDIAVSPAEAVVLADPPAAIEDGLIASANQSDGRSQSDWPARGRLEVLDGLRGLAVFLVVLYHIWQFSWIDYNAKLHTLDLPFGLGFSIAYIPAVGFFGVDLFFFLSAFCLTYPYARHWIGEAGRPTLGHYASRRVAKIAPSYFLVIAIIFWFFPHDFTPDRNWFQVGTHLLFIHNWFAESNGTFTSPLWSMATEVQFYVLFPLIMWTFRRAPLWTVGAMVGVALVWRSLITGWMFSDHDCGMYTLRDSQVFAYMDTYAAGMVGACAVVYLRRQPWVLRSGRLFSLLAVAALATFFLQMRDCFLTPMDRPYTIPLWQVQHRLEMSLVFIVLAVSGSLASRGVRLAVANPVTVFLSVVSYNLYLWHHFIALWMVNHRVPAPATADPHMDRHWMDVYTLGAWGAALLVASVITYAWERPFLRGTPLRLLRFAPPFARLAAVPRLAPATATTAADPAVPSQEFLAVWERRASSGSLFSRLRQRAEEASAETTARQDGDAGDSAPEDSVAETGDMTPPSARRVLDLLVPKRPLLLLYGTVGLYLLVLVPRLMWFDPHDGSLWCGSLHLWSDWPFHMSMAERFAYCPPQDWLAQHPMICGEPLRYPFFSAFVSGMLLRLGLSMPAAMIAPMLFSFLILLPGMLALYRLTLGGGYRNVVAVILFFCAAGLGFVDWIHDVSAARTLAAAFQLLINPRTDYSGVDQYGWYSSNFLGALLLPQRAFLPGLTVGVWVLVLLMFTFTFWDCYPPASRNWRLLLGGVLGGVTPVMHVHSWFALAVLSLFVIIPFAGRDGSRWRPILLFYALPGLSIAALLYRLFFVPVHHYPNFVSWCPGVNAERGFLDWLRMWWIIWGIMLPVTIVGALPLWKRLRKGNWRIGLFVGAFVLFGISNVIKFQPTGWDNSKLYLWVYLVLARIAAEILADLWRVGPPIRRWLRFLGWQDSARPLLRVVAVAVFLGLSLSGLLVLISLQRTDVNKQEVLGREDMVHGDFVRTHTPPNASFLNDGYSGDWVMAWAGRGVFRGFSGWIPNFGMPDAVFEQRCADLITMYRGTPQAIPLLAHYRIDYVKIEWGDRAMIPANEPWYEAHFPLLYRDGDLAIYDTRSAVALAAAAPGAAGSAAPHNAAESLTRP